MVKIWLYVLIALLNPGFFDKVTALETVEFRPRNNLDQTSTSDDNNGVCNRYTKSVCVDQQCCSWNVNSNTCIPRAGNRLPERQQTSDSLSTLNTGDVSGSFGANCTINGDRGVCKVR